MIKFSVKFIYIYFSSWQTIPSMNKIHVNNQTSTADSTLMPFSGTCHLPNLATHSSWESDSSHPIKKLSSGFASYFKIFVVFNFELLKKIFPATLKNVLLLIKNQKKIRLWIFLCLSFNFNYYYYYSFLFNLRFFWGGFLGGLEGFFN